MTDNDTHDPLDDPAMAHMLRRLGAQMSVDTTAPLSAYRRASLDEQLDAIDAELGRRRVRPRSRPAWLWLSAAAAVVIGGIGAALLLRSSEVALPRVSAQVARAEAVRGAPPPTGFTVDIDAPEPGFVKIYAFTMDGRRRALALRDDQLIEPVSQRTRFGEFDLPDAWRVLVAFAREREPLTALDTATPAQLAGGTSAARLRALEQVAAELRGKGIAALEMAVP